MKILAIVPYVPNLVRVRPYQILRGLAARGHAVTLLTLLSTKEEENSIAPLEALGIRVEALPLGKLRAYGNCLMAVPSPTPLQAVYCWHPGLAERAVQLCAQERYDAVHVEHLRGVQYARYLGRASARPAPPILWDSVDSISHLFRQAVANEPSALKRALRTIELRRTERFEAELCRELACITVTSPLDQAAFEKLAGQFNVPLRAGLHVIPNGTDLDYFSPDAGTPRDRRTLVVSGKMSYHANIHMTLFLVREVLPLVWREEPEARLLVVGKDPPETLRALGSDPRIQITGTVADIRPFLRQAAIAVAPVRYGAGIQNKVLEAMGCATPVICSPTAVSALQARPEQDLLVADRAEDFSRQILRLFRDASLCEQIGLAGRKYVEGHHRWETIVAQLETLYMDLKPGRS
jgi:polysaccharide biosynthesis protein PslH